MKLLRPLLISIAVLVVLLVVIIALAFMPAVQTWAARRVLAGQPGPQVGLDRVAAGLQGVEVDGVRVTQPGLKLTLPALEADFPLLSAAGKKVMVRKLVAKGWTLDLTAPGAKSKPTPAPVPAAAAREAFQGVFAQLHLPVDLAVDSVELSGDVIFPTAPGQPPGHAHVTLTGGGLAAGREGKFDYQVDATLAGPAAAVQSLAVRGSFTAALDSPRTFSHLGFSADATATGAKFPQGARLHIGVDALRATAGEHYAVVFDTDGKHLFSLNADYPAGAGKLAGGWRLNARDADLAPFTLGRTLPAFEATGEGSLQSDAAFDAVHAAGHLRISAERLEAIRAELRALGRLTLDANFDLTQNAADTRVDHFDLTVTGTQPVAEVHALQSFEFNAKSGELKVAEPARSLLSIELKGVPLAWAQPFLSGLAVTGSDVTGVLQASARDGGLHLESSAPIALNNLAVAQAGKPLLRLDRVTLGFNADYAPQQGWQAELEAGAQSGSKTLFTLQTKAGCRSGPAQPIKATGQLQADLAAVLAQPALASMPQLTAGDARIEFQASLGDKKEIEAKLSLAKLVAPQVPLLPSVTADVRAELASDGKITLNAPVVLENAGRKSDLTLSGTLQSGGGGLNVDVRVTSELIVADDLKALTPLAAKPAGPAPAQPQPSANAAPPPSEGLRDAAPFWKGVNGHLVLALKKVVYGQFEVDDIAGDLKLGPDAVALDQFRAVLGSGGTASLAGAVNFAAAAPEPYTLKANVNVTDLDTAPLFRALDPSKPPTVQGKFNLTGQATGGGINVLDLGQRAHGNGSLTSKGGVFRLFAGLTAISSELDKTTKISKAASTVGSLASILTGKKSYGDVANKAQVVLEFANTIAEIQYDQLSVTVSRDEQLNTFLNDFTLISPERRLLGSGQVTYKAGTPFLEQPLTAEFKLSARGQTADLLNRLGVLDSQTDDLGYSICTLPLKAGGTLTNPDVSELKNQLVKIAVERAGGSLLNKVFGH